MIKLDSNTTEAKAWLVCVENIVNRNMLLTIHTFVYPDNNSYLNTRLNFEWSLLYSNCCSSRGLQYSGLAHWGRATHIRVSEIIFIGSDNGLSPGRRRTIIWTNFGILLIGPLGMNFSEILIEISIFTFKKMHLMSSTKWCLFRLGLNVLKEAKTYCRSCTVNFLVWFSRIPGMTSWAQTAFEVLVFQLQGWLRIRCVNLDSARRKEYNYSWPKDVIKTHSLCMQCYAW